MTGKPLSPEHETLRSLYTYWLSKKGDRIAPPRSAIRPEEIPQLLPYLAIVEAVGDPPRFRVRLVGTGVTAAFGRDSTGKFVDELDYADKSPGVNALLRGIAAHNRPDLGRAELTLADGRHVSYERLILPLSSDNAKIDMLLVCFAVERSYSSRL
jgi:hypothetical protein